MRARGANAQVAIAFPSFYGGVPGSGFTKIPFSQIALGETQGLVESDVLGYGRNPLEPDLDVIVNDGSITVPVDQRLFGLHLKLLLGAPQTTQGVAATGKLTFALQPTVNSTITIGGQAFTFKASAPGANDILIGATVAETVRNTVWALNRSAVAGVAVASYSTDLDAAAVTVTYDAVGTGGNAMTIAAGSSPASNVTVSGATLAGGSAAGPYNHVFKAGALILPDAAIEIGMPDVPTFAMNYGAMYNTLAVPMQRSGNLNATFNIIAQGEKPRTTTSAAGTLAELVLTRFSQFTGFIEREGVPLGNIVSGAMNVSNGLDKAEVIRADGRIDGVDPGMVAVTPEIVSRFADMSLLDLATGRTPVDIAFGWRAGPDARLTFRVPQLRLPKPQLPVTGPGGVQGTFPGQAHRNAAGDVLIVTLVNDVASYA
ncbi:phage tail tube protein [Caulobacter sp. Root1472]|uniref:phage tail tube protein n=1 Tax=Caulobacter sp. Root1472 TaxID=1736470 RepID=UPI0006FFA78B|nr:phage tail tube protein [Caulobacter sp. Root1472]KQZ31725.1 hypothetical protein ASD47_15755 [Caulobacter sp. Root1472]